MKENLEKIADAGFGYSKRNYFDKDIDIYESITGRIYYNRKTDAIVMEIPKEAQASYNGECKFIVKK